MRTCHFKLMLILLSTIPLFFLSCKKEKQSDSFTIQFYTSGGTEISSMTVISGREIKKPEDPFKKDSTLEGWYLDPELTESFTFGVTYYTTKGFNLYAKWTKGHVIVFDTDGAPEIDTQTVFAGKYLFKPQEPAKEGYAFVGWYTDPLFQNAFDFSTPIHQDYKLYAKFVVEEYFDVIFNTNGGSNISAQSIKGGQLVTKPKTILAGKTLVGWYIDPAYQAPFNFMNTPITSDINLYAKWATSNPESDFTFDESKGMITGYSGSSLDVVIPETIKGKDVIALGYALFIDRPIISVVLPSSVITLEGKTEGTFDNVSRTFHGCWQLTSINLFNTAISVLPKWTFWSAKLGTIVLPGTLTKIDQGCFESSQLTSIDIPNSVTTIEQYSFFRCKNLTKVILGNSLTLIGNGAFAESSILNEIVITKGSLPITNLGVDNPFRDVSPSFTIKAPKVVLENYKSGWSALSGKIIGY